jgi:LacI family transcriptional regulator
MRDVARTAGVSLSSASRALSGHPDVSDELREQVRNAARQLGYEQNLVWESLRRGSTQTVGLIVRDISSPLFAEIALKADLTLREAGYSLLVSNSMGAASHDAAQIRLLHQRRVDGLIASPTDIANPETLAALERMPVPVVMIDRDLPDYLGTSAVLIDHRSGMTSAVTHLLDLGHRSIGYVATTAGTRPAYETARVLDELCRERGVQTRIEFGPFSSEHGLAATRRLLDVDDPPTALISGSNQIFPGVMQALRERGLRIPRDISLVTLDELPTLPFVDPPISAVSRHPAEVGRAAAQLMLERLQGEPPRIVVTPAEFTPRGSCGPPPRRRRKPAV